MDFDLQQGFGTVTHGKAKLVFNVKLLRIKHPTEKVFGPINDYFATLPMATQEAMFEEMKTVYGVFYNATIGKASSQEYTIDRTVDSVGRFFKMFDYNHMRRWCADNTGFCYPEDLKHDQVNYKEDTTYLHRDYAGLLFLSTLLKPMMLIWGDFITRFKDEYGTKHKELVALPLIRKTGILDLPEYQKLHRYVFATTSGAEGTLNSNICGLGTAGLSDYGLATTIVRRVSTGVVGDPNISLIRLIYGHLDSGVTKPNVLENMDGKKRYYERTPPPTANGSADEDRASVIDTYRLRQSQADHVSMISEVFLENPLVVLLKVDPTAAESPNFGAYKKMLEQGSIDKYRDLDIEEYHIRFCAIATAEVIAPRILPLLQFVPLLTLVVVTQALLHHWGFPDLAAMMTARTRIVDLDVINNISPVPVPREIQEELAALYCHRRPSSRTEARNPKPLNFNYGMIFIKEIEEELNQYIWRYDNHEGLYTEKAIHNSHMSLPRDLRTQVANLLLKTRK